MTEKKSTAFVNRDRLHVANKPKGFRLRWCDRDEVSITNRLEDGWVFVDKTKGIPVGVDGNYDGRVPDGIHVRRDMVLMALPEEIGKARDEHYQSMADAQVAGIKRKAENDMKRIGPDGNVYGKVTVIQ